LLNVAREHDTIPKSFSYGVEEGVQGSSCLLTVHLSAPGKPFSVAGMPRDMLDPAVSQSASLAHDAASLSLVSSTLICIDVHPDVGNCVTVLRVTAPDSDEMKLIEDNQTEY
jgi:hypothetical protein